MLRPQTMRFWELCPAPNANFIAFTWLRTPFWPARLLPHRCFLPFFYLLWGKRGFIRSLMCSLPQTSISVSSFSLLLNGAQHPSQLTLALHVRASCYCQGKTSSFLPLPCGLYVLSLALSAFASPTRQRVECKYSSFCAQAQNLSWSRAAEPLPRHTTYVVNKHVLLSPPHQPYGYGLACDLALPPA